MKLYLDPVATTCRPIMMFLADHDVAFQTVSLCLADGDHAELWFRDINPEALVPVLDDGDFRLTESASILRYLASKLHSAAYPVDLQARARVDEALDWLNTSLLRDFAFGFAYPQLLREQHGFADDIAQRAYLERGLARTDRLFGSLERKLTISSGPYLLGQQITLADYFGASIATVSQLVQFDLTQFPAVATWLAAMKARPSWRPCNAAFEGWVAAMKSPNSTAA